MVPAIAKSCVSRSAHYVFSLSLVLLAVTASHRAESKPRQHFEPTDLELEDPGDLDFDFQYGWVKGPGTYRLVTPDTEIDLGIAKNVELDIDFAYGIEATIHPLSLKHPVSDNTWLSAKLGLWSTRDEIAKSSWAIGVQTGPKIPLADGAHGAGYESLLLVGRNFERTHLVLNVGGLVDPGATFSKRRPIGVEMGLDIEQDLDKNGIIALLGEIGAIHYFSHDPDQFQVTYGIQLEPEPNTDFSLIGLLGAPPGGDHFGVLFGYSPKFALWR